MGDEHKRPGLIHRDDHVIPRNQAHDLPDPASSVDRVRNQRQLRAASLVIKLAADRGNNTARCRRQDRGAEPDKDLRGLRRQHRAPTALRRMAQFVDGDEVDRECRAVQMGAMTGNTVSRAVHCYLTALEWQAQHK